MFRPNLEPEEETPAADAYTMEVDGGMTSSDATKPDESEESKI